MSSGREQPWGKEERACDNSLRAGRARRPHGVGGPRSWPAGERGLRRYAVALAPPRGQGIDCRTRVGIGRAGGEQHECVDSRKRSARPGVQGVEEQRGRPQDRRCRSTGRPRSRSSARRRLPPRRSWRRRRQLDAGGRRGCGTPGRTGGARPEPDARRPGELEQGGPRRRHLKIQRARRNTPARKSSSDRGGEQFDGLPGSRMAAAVRHEQHVAHPGQPGASRTTSPTTVTAGGRTERRSASSAMVATVANVVRCLGPKPSSTTATGVSAESPRASNVAARASELGDAHEQDQRVICRDRDAAELVVAGGHGERPSHTAVRHRDAGRGRHGDRAGHAGHDLDLDPRGEAGGDAPRHHGPRTYGSPPLSRTTRRPACACVINSSLIASWGTG